VCGCISITMYIIAIEPPADVQFIPLIKKLLILTLCTI